ncbi:hypothetical protein [Alteromonas sp. 14N.309.X.WAT.G.H12]|uniref:hypothetical protein n=1 Tax=Alteromonas sp. 14N.309.X.WAT.G.H12 TaxID=3120824 RepID=UPI002FD77358
MTGEQLMVSITRASGVAGKKREEKLTQLRFILFISHLIKQTHQKHVRMMKFLKKGLVIDRRVVNQLFMKWAIPTRLPK